jgi:outer membrane protein
MRPLIAIGLAVLLAPAARADDLLQVFDRATTNDPQIREADATRKANREARPQAWAALLPQLSAVAAETRDENDGFSDRTQIIPDPTAPGGVRAIAVPTGGQSEPESTRWSVDLRQSVFSWADWVALKRANKQVAQAEADYLVAQQDLALRVATRYFDVLAAQDNVQSQQTALDAISRQLEQAEKRFEVGLIAITDVQEAKAARDNGAAALIAAKRQLASAEEFLRELIGDKPLALAKPTAEMPLATPNPAEEQQWVDLSMQQNTALTSSRLAADIARDNVRAAFGGHLPTIDFVASRSGFKQDQTVDLPPESVPPNGQTLALTTDTDSTSYSLQFSLPLFSGGGTQSRVRESEYRWLAARERLERTSRQTERLARDAYLGVLSGISRVQALKQALESTQTALKATEAGYEVGTRTAVDVLDSRRRLAQSETDYARARYDYILSVLQLRLAAGSLDRKALEEVNGWLAQQ